jgi:hypothetical protein
MLTRLDDDTYSNSCIYIKRPQSWIQMSLIDTIIHIHLYICMHATHILLYMVHMLIYNLYIYMHVLWQHTYNYLCRYISDNTCTVFIIHFKCLCIYKELCMHTSVYKYLYICHLSAAVYPPVPRYLWYPKGLVPRYPKYINIHWCSNPFSIHLPM